MTVPAGIVDEAEASFDGEGAQCSLSLGAVMEDMRSAASCWSPHESSRSWELFEIELARDEVDVVATLVSAVDMDLACEELGECVPILVCDDRPDSETCSC